MNERKCDESSSRETELPWKGSSKVKHTHNCVFNLAHALVLCSRHKGMPVVVVAFAFISDSIRSRRWATFADRTFAVTVIVGAVVRQQQQTIEPLQVGLRALPTFESPSETLRKREHCPLPRLIWITVSVCSRSVCVAKVQRTCTWKSTDPIEIKIQLKCNESERARVHVCKELVDSHINMPIGSISQIYIPNATFYSTKYVAQLSPHTHTHACIPAN